MPLVVAVSLFKGGVGKTTTSLALAEAAATAGLDTTLVDTDPMGAAMRWAALAEAAGQPLLATVVGHSSATLARRLSTLIAGAGFVVIDAPPPGAQAAIDTANVVVIPVPARMADLDRVPATLDAARHNGHQVLAVMTFARNVALDEQRTRAEVAARGALASWGVQVLDTALPTRVSVANAYGRRPTGVLAQFGRELLDEISRKATP